MYLSLQGELDLYCLTVILTYTTIGCLINYYVLRATIERCNYLIELTLCYDVMMIVHYVLHMMTFHYVMMVLH